MFGRKDKKVDRKRGREKQPEKKGGSDLAAMFGLNIEMPNDSELEAELMAMQGVGVSGGGGRGPMKMADIDKMVAGIDADDDETYSDLSDIDEDELLGELQAMEGTGQPSPPAQPPPSKATSSSVQGVKLVSSRLTLYRQAVTEAEASGENSKVKRYKRAVTTLEQLLKGAERGQTVDEEELPPLIALKGKPKPPPAKQLSITLDDSEFNFDEDELTAMASSLVDDRQAQPNKPEPSPQQQNITASKPSPSPRQQAPLTHKPSPSPRQPLYKTEPLSQQKTPPVVKQQLQQAPPPPKPSVRMEPPAIKPDGMIDLDAPEFDEFTLSEEDLEAMAASFVDDRKKPKLDNETISPIKNENKLPIPNKPSQSLPASMTQPSSNDEVTVQHLLAERRDQYLSASKERPDKTREYRVIAAQFNKILKAFEAGQEINLSEMPGPPPGYKASFNVDISQYAVPTNKQVQGSSSPMQGQSPNSSLSSQGQSAVADTEEVNSEIPVPKTIMEALQQRLAKYQEGIRSAKDKGESSRVRRLGRIVKSYESAIKATQTGKPFDYEELPTPPGYPPIPVPRGLQPRPPILPPTQSLPTSISTSPRPPSLNREQLQLVEERRAELQRAAKQEQGKGNREQALYYLRLRKGLDTMLDASRSGAPVNLEQLPPSPFADISQTKPSTAVLSHLKPATDADVATFDLIEKQLQKQKKICDTNADTYKKMGSSPAAIQYENMAQNCAKELLAIKGIRSQGLGPPKFTMETRKFTIVHSNSELSSSVCEVEVVCGYNLPRPDGYEEKDMCVYVEAEFPWPTDNPQKKSCDPVRHSCDPEFTNQRLSFEIDRKKIKTMIRTFKRSPVKCAVWQKRTLRKDLFIGLAQLSLDSLENKCNVNMTLDLTDERGRKQTGGRLELTARLREPLSGTDKEEREEQWLVFKESIAAKSSVSMPKPGAPATSKGQSSLNIALLSPVKVETTVSLEALKLEFSLVQSAMKAGHRDKPTALKGKMIQERMDAIKKKLQSDPSFRQNYSRLVTKDMNSEQQLEAQLTKQGKRAEVAILGKRRAAMEKELKSLQARKL